MATTTTSCKTYGKLDRPFVMNYTPRTSKAPGWLIHFLHILCIAMNVVTTVVVPLFVLPKQWFEHGRTQWYKSVTYGLISFIYLHFFATSYLIHEIMIQRCESKMCHTTVLQKFNQCLIFKLVIGIMFTIVHGYIIIVVFGFLIWCVIEILFCQRIITIHGSRLCRSHAHIDQEKELQTPNSPKIEQEDIPKVHKSTTQNHNTSQQLLIM